MPTLTTHRPIILLVDDDPEALDILRRLLDAFTEHAEIVAVASGAAALAVTKVCPVALVITDYHMPEMNGIALTRRIKAASPVTPVAIMSVDDADDIANQATAAAAEYVLTKPYILTELKGLIEACLPNQKAVPDAP